MLITSLHCLHELSLIPLSHPSFCDLWVPWRQQTFFWHFLRAIFVSGNPLLLPGPFTPQPPPNKKSLPKTSRGPRTWNIRIHWSRANGLFNKTSSKQGCSPGVRCFDLTDSWWFPQFPNRKDKKVGEKKGWPWPTSTAATIRFSSCLQTYGNRTITLKHVFLISSGLYRKKRHETWVDSPNRDHVCWKPPNVAIFLSSICSKNVLENHKTYILPNGGLLWNGSLGDFHPMGSQAVKTHQTKTNPSWFTLVDLDNPKT